MKKNIIKASYFLLSVLAVAASVYFGRDIPFSEQWPLYEALRTTAAIIFAVVGAWIAIRFPDRKVTIIGENNLASREGIGRYFHPVAHSIVVLCSVLIIGLVAPIVKRLEFVQLHVDIFRGLSYGVLAALTLFQLWTVIISLGPAAELKHDADIASAESARQHNRKRLGSYAPEDYETTDSSAN